MKKFTKIILIVAAVLAGVGLLLCGISSMMGAGYGTIRQMARRGELDYGNWHLREHGLYYAPEDEWDASDEWDEADEPDEVDEVDEPDIMDELDVMDEPDEVDDLAELDRLDNWQNWYSAEQHNENGHHGARLAATGSYTYPVENIRNLTLDIGAASIVFTEGSDKSQIAVTLYDCNERYYKGGMDGDTLEIIYDKEHHHLNNSNHAKILVEVPAGMAFTVMKLDIGAAYAEFAMKDVSCKKLSMDIGAADVTVNGFTVTDSLKLDIGAGAVEIKGGSYRDINLDCGMGEIVMKGSVTGDIDADCGMGSMTLDLSGSETDYNYDISCDMGDVSVNGKSYASIGGNEVITNAGATGTVTLDCGMGAIELNIR